MSGPPPRQLASDLSAVIASVAGPSRTFSRFCDELGACGPPAFIETSVRMGDSLQARRLTAYYDAAASASKGTDALVRSADALGIRLPKAFRAALANERFGFRSLVQLGVGIDVRADPDQTRLKCYLVFDGPSDDAARAWGEALEHPLPDSVPAHCLHILAADFGTRGLVDMKAYVALDPARVRATLRVGPVDFGIIESCKSIVLQRSCLLPRADRYHFVAAHPDPIWLTLGAAKFDHTNALEDLHEHVFALRSDGVEWVPWILSLPCRRGRVNVDEATVYLHANVAPVVASGQPARSLRRRYAAGE